jgi:RNA polymerase sigma-70 factor (ECF subfamily)
MAQVEPDAVSADSPRSQPIEELFQTLESPLLGYALRLARDRAVAEDIVQDAFMKLHAQFDEVEEPRRWLFRTVHNLALNHQRSAGRTVPLTPSNPAGSSDAPGSGELDTADPQPLPDEQIIRLEGIGLVRLTLESLDERSRELLRLKFNDDLSYKEISARTGLTVGHVGYLLHHALKAMAAELAKIGETR